MLLENSFDIELLDTEEFDEDLLQHLCSERGCGITFDGRTPMMIGAILLVRACKHCDEGLEHDARTVWFYTARLVGMFFDQKQRQLLVTIKIRAGHTIRRTQYFTYYYLLKRDDDLGKIEPTSDEVEVSSHLVDLIQVAKLDFQPHVVDSDQI